MRIQFLLYITFLLVNFETGTLTIYGQNKATQNTIQDVEFVIKKEHKNELPESHRLVKKAPLAVVTEQAIYPVIYSFKDIDYTFPSLDHKIKILRAKEDRAITLYGKYLKVGYGNFYSPYLSVFLDNTQNNKYAYGLHFRHISEGKQGHAEENHNGLKIHGKTFTDKLVIGGFIDYGQDKYPWKNLIDNSNNSNSIIYYSQYKQIQLHAELYNCVTGGLNYHMDTKITHLRNHLTSQENQGKGTIHVEYLLGEIFQIHTDLRYHLTQFTNNNTSIKRYVGSLNPVLITKLNKFFTIQTGANLAYQNQPKGPAKAFQVYPDIKLLYTFAKKLRPYMGIRGGIRTHSWQDCIAKNPWLDPTTELRHTNQDFAFYMGLKSDIKNKISIHPQISVSRYQNWPCFVNDKVEARQFYIDYEPEATVVKLSTEITKISLAETLVSRLKIDYYQYTLTQLSKAWHRPQYHVSFLNTYNFQEKFLLKNKIYWLGGKYALDPASNNTVSLPAIVDIGIGIEYLWNQRFSIFLNLENLLNKANNHYLHSPTNGTHLLAGITYGW